MIIAGQQIFYLQNFCVVKGNSKVIIKLIVKTEKEI